MSYTPLDYASMLGDKGRMTAYTSALKRAITPNSIVLDLGTGMGYFAVLACFLGAKKVYAIEPNSAIKVGKQLASDNGVADRITWYEDLSTNVSLPEKVDVIVSDLRGLLPHNEGNLPAIIDARTRFLKPNGKLLPQKDRIDVAIASDAEAYSNNKTPWKPLDLPDINLSSYEKALSNTFISRETKSSDVISDHLNWAEIDYSTATTLNNRKALEFTINRDGPAHGIYVWFDAQVDPEATYSFAPDHPMSVYGSAFFPWSERIDVKKNDKVTIDLAVHFGSNGFDWTWKTAHLPSVTGKSVTRFQQSTFFDSDAISKDAIKRQSPQFTPDLSQEGRITLRAMSLMDQTRTIAQIAQLLESEFSATKNTSETWLRLVSDLSLEFTD